MIKELMHDPIFLAGKSDVATKDDLQVAEDLLETLMAHSYLHAVKKNADETYQTLFAGYAEKFDIELEKC